MDKPKHYSIWIESDCGTKILFGTTLCPDHRALRQYQLEGAEPNSEQGQSIPTYYNLTPDNFKSVDEKLRDKIEEQVHEARLQPNEVFCEEFVNAIMELHTAHLQAAVQQARIEERRDMKLGFLRELANKPAPKGDDVYPEYTKGWVSMQGKIKFEIQRLQQLKQDTL